MARHPYEVSIWWGSEETRQQNITATTYGYETVEEMKAFLDAVDLALEQFEGDGLDGDAILAELALEDAPEPVQAAALAGYNVADGFEDYAVVRARGDMPGLEIAPLGEFEQAVAGRLEVEFRKAGVAEDALDDLVHEIAADDAIKAMSEVLDCVEPEDGESVLEYFGETAAEINNQGMRDQICYLLLAGCTEESIRQRIEQDQAPSPRGPRP